MPDFLTAGLVEVRLPSGATVRGVLPTLADLMRYDLVPTGLRDAALSFADPKMLQKVEDGPSPVVAWYELTHRLICRFVREVRTADGWEPVTVTLDALGTPERAGTMDPRDVDLLEDLVLRLRTPEQASRTTLAMLTDDVNAGIRRLAEEAPDDSDLEPFRPESGGAEGGEDGEPLGDPPVRDARAA